MNIFFVYKNQTFDFELKTDVSIVSLKNMVSKILEKDKNSFDLFYNNKILPEKESSLYKITNGKKNISIIIMLKQNNNMNKNNKRIDLPFLSLSNPKHNIKIENDSIDNDMILNDTEMFSSSSTKKSYLKNIQKNPTKSKDKPMKIQYTTRNKVFEDIYSTKEEIIIHLMKKLKNKLLGYDNILYKLNDSELLLYEKNIINYKDKQIHFLTKLINHFDNEKASSLFFKGKISLKDFYQEISNYNSYTNNNTFIQNYSMKKEKKIINKNISIKLTNFGENNLPKISVTKNLEDNLYRYTDLSEDSYRNNDGEIKREKNDLRYFSNKKLIDPRKISKSFRNYIEPNLGIENITPIEKKKKINKFIFDKSNLGLEKINQKNKIRLENPIEENNIRLENNKFNLMKKQNLKDENKLFDQKRKQFKTFEKEGPKIEKIIEIPSINQLSRKNSINQNDRELRISFDKNKIGVLFDIAENNSEYSIISDDDNLMNKKLKRKRIIERNLTERKKNLGIMAKTTSIGYRVKAKEKKTTHRIKKLGNTYSDFVI
jgi:hypothetical protein